jgi:hypothetical protein
VKLIPVRARLRATLLACALAAPLSALAPGAAAALHAHPAANAGNVAQRAAGLWHTSKKTVVSLRDLAAAEGKASAEGKTAGGQPVTAPGTAAPLPSASPSSATATAGVSVAAAFAPTLAVNFPGLASDGNGPPDPNAAASPTQIVEVVNNRLQVYTRGGRRQAAPPT